MTTATQLFAKARGIAVTAGEHRCYLCGGFCAAHAPAASFIQKSFTARDTVCGGEWVCEGCIESFQENAAIVLPTGESRDLQMVRGYSWLIGSKAIAATKAHRGWLLEQCLSPPAQPFVISISDSGQKHLLYRAVVCHSQTHITATLEGERIHYAPEALAARIELCRKLVAATGKPALSESLSHSAAMRIVSHHGDESLIRDWSAVREQPLSRLAIWLCEPKEQCLERYPAAVN